METWIMALETVTNVDDEQATALGDPGTDGTETPGADGGTSDPAAELSADDQQEQFYSQDEFDKFIQDPIGTYKAMQKAFTQKTQAIAAQRKQLEPGLGLLEKLANDPQGTVKQLASELGLTFQEAKAVAAAAAGGKEPDVVDEVRTDLTGLFGEEITGKLLPAIDRLLDHRTKAVVTPMQKAVEKFQQEQAQREAASTLQAFQAKHPDWKTYEPIMTKLGEKVVPADGVYDIDFLEHLYNLSTGQAARARDARATGERMLGSAKAAAENGKRRAAPGGQFSPAPPPAASLDEAIERGFEAAKRGQRFQY